MIHTLRLVEIFTTAIKRRHLLLYCKLRYYIFITKHDSILTKLKLKLSLNIHWRDDQIDWKPLIAHYTAYDARASMAPL
ncbi:hypothetical protein PRJ_Fausto_00492 [Faustovirus]|nr:hypothetical protein PRJ_Fausto_00492 [Faustovirus]QBR99101.1 hypothetical protein [Faustovirus mariensis]